MRAILLFTAAAAAASTLLAAPPACASPYVRYGIQDDAWLRFGPGGTLGDRLDELDRLGVEVVRYTLDWRQIAPTRPANGRNPDDPAYDWSSADDLVHGLRRHGIEALLTLWGSPAWANGGRSPNWAPTSGATFAAFATAVQRRYPWVRRWLIWNEPNKAPFLRPVSPRVYVRRLLNPAYAALHAANPKAVVGGGVTGPQAGAGGMSPVDFIRGLGSEGAQLDAYAHNPYPASPNETPWEGGCARCETITLATLERLLFWVDRALGTTRIWLTEHGYQTNPPDLLFGVSPARQATYLGSAALRAYLAPRVDLLIQFLIRDDAELGGWQSGLTYVTGRAKPSFDAFRLPLAQRSRDGRRTTLWGQVRPRAGRQPYRLQQLRAGSWGWVGAAQMTDAKGAFVRTVDAGRGARFRVWSPRDRIYSAVLVVT
jgi:hypothetical protein